MTTYRYETSVFLNCPFDTQYSPLFQAAIFAVADCGFQIRCSLEISDTSQIRLQKIYELVGACQYGIHDISHVQIDEGSQLPRFNMPLEFGIFLGAKVFGDNQQKQKMCLVFDELPYRYQKYVSDISGQDIESHHNDPETLIVCVRNWLASLCFDTLPSGSVIWERYQRFQKELVGLCEIAEQKIDELTYNDLLKHIHVFTTKKVDVLETGLESRWGKRLEEPSLLHIREAIEGLNGGSDSFVILFKSGGGRSFLQVSGSKPEGFQLEYSNGSLEDFYRCADSYLDEEQIINVFQTYRKSQSSWKTSLIRICILSSAVAS